MRVNQTSVTVDDQDKAFRFYTKVLGFVKKTLYPLDVDEVRKRMTLVSPSNKNGPELVLEPMHSALERATKDWQKTLYKHNIPAAAFEVEDIKKEFKRLSKLGVKFIQAPIRAGGPITWALLDDTCGNLIQLFEYWDYHGETRSVTVERHIAAPPEQVFAAWINPELACKWLMASAESVPGDYALDTQVGGEWTIHRRSGDKIYTAVGEYVEIDPPRRLVFTFSMPQFAVDVGTVTVEIKPDKSGSLVRLTQSGDRPGYERSTAHGWEGMLIRLERALTGKTGQKMLTRTPSKKAKSAKTTKKR